MQNINKLITIVITSRQTIARVMNDSPEPETRMITVISDVGAGVRETERPEPEHGSGKSDGLSLSLSLLRISPEPKPGVRYTRCMVAGPDPDIRAHDCHHKQRYY